MKKIFGLVLLCSLLSGCNLNINFSSGSSSNNYPSSSSLNNSSLNNSSISSVNIGSSIDITGMKTITLDYNSVYADFNYNTGNYGNFTSTAKFEYYRTHRSKSELMHFVPYVSNNSLEGLNSSLYNTTTICGIKRIDIEYKTDSIAGDNPIVKLGESRFYTYEVNLPLTTSYNVTSLTFNNDNYNFFSIESSSMKLTIDSIKIYYLNNQSGYVNVPQRDANEGEYRINIPTLSDNELVSGVTTATVPTKVKFVNNECVVEETKTYTYYEYSDVIYNSSLISKASWTDPMDVSNYFVSFGTYPVNYVFKNNYSSAYSYFKENTRCVSTYTRTDGYAKSVPYEVGSNNKPYYYECDIALDDTYSSSKRGVGRLVIWEYGFSNSKGAIGYSSSPVVVYTDDHYATFKEYFNCGVFGDRFDSERNRVHQIWSCPTTVEINS